MQWDSLLGQVPVVGLTAQAFLFTIALDPASSRLARVISASLSVVATLMCMHLMASDRRAEVTDAHWLRDIETQTGRLGIHGAAFRDRRDATDPDVKFPVRWLLKARSLNVWMAGLAAFGLAALVVLTVIAQRSGSRRAVSARGLDVRLFVPTAGPQVSGALGV